MGSSDETMPDLGPCYFNSIAAAQRRSTHLLLLANLSHAISSRPDSSLHGARWLANLETGMQDGSSTSTHGRTRSVNDSVHSPRRGSSRTSCMSHYMTQIPAVKIIIERDGKEKSRRSQAAALSFIQKLAWMIDGGLAKSTLFLVPP